MSFFFPMYVYHCALLIFTLHHYLLLSPTNWPLSSSNSPLLQTVSKIEIISQVVVVYAF